MAYAILRSFMVLALLTPLFSAAPTTRAVSPSARAPAYPLTFEADNPEPDRATQFQAQTSEMTLLLRPAEMILHLVPAATALARPNALSPTGRPLTFGTAQLKFRFSGTSAAASLRGEHWLSAACPWPERSSPQDHGQKLPLFARVRCQNLYPNIDLLYYGTDSGCKYDLLLGPRANPASIRMHVSGFDQISIDKKGDIILLTKSGTVRHHQPVAYQITPRGIQPVPAAWALETAPGPALADARPEAVVRFALGDFDPAYPLVIDPTLSFASPVGGDGEDQAYSVAVDREGCIYIAGQTTSPSISDTPSALLGQRGGYDVFVVKYARDGQSLLYSAILGGSGEDRGYDMAVTSQGEVVVVGSTTSADFPVHQASQPTYGGGDRDGFVAVLNAQGSALAWASYLGGSGSEDLATVAVDHQDRICVGGATQSTNLPTRRAWQEQNRGSFDALVARWEANGQLDFCTYLGGSGLNDSVLGLAVDATDNIYLTGYTLSEDFPKVNAYQNVFLGGYEAFVARLSAHGLTLDFSTLLGGTGDDVAHSVAVDPQGNVYVCGDTSSGSFPVVKALQPNHAGRRDVFVSKFDPTGSVLLFSTYFGGAGEELASLCLDHSGAIALAGVTSSRNFPTVSAFQPSFGGGIWDAFVATLKSDGSGVLFSSFLGGDGNDQVSALTADSRGNLYLAGSTTSTDIPMVRPHQKVLRANSYDAFVAQITPLASTNLYQPSVQASRPTPRPGPSAGTPPPAPRLWDTLGPALPLFGKNLITNGNAETVPSQTSPEPENSVPGWITDGPVRLQAYAQSPTVKLPTNGASHYFTGGSATTTGRARQEIPLTPAASFIDTGEVRFSAEALLCGWQDHTNIAVVYLKFLDLSDQVLAQAQLGPVIGKNRSFFNRLVPRAAHGNVPAGTRRVTVEMVLTPDTHHAAPAFADALSLVLQRPPASLLQLTRLGNQIQLSWPASLSGIVLESSPRLPPNSPWSVVTNPPTVSTDQNILVRDLDHADAYYRLRRE